MRLSNDLYLVGSGGVGISHVSDCHVYLIDGHSEVGVIDAGCGIRSDRIIENIRKEGVPIKKLSVLLVTHSHWDHGRGVSFLKKQSDGCRLGIHSDGINMIERDLWRGRPVSDAGFVSEETKVDIGFKDGQIIPIGEYQVRVIFTPGHSTDSVCFLTEIGGQKILFTGDTMSGEGRLGITSAETNFSEYRQSLEKLLAHKPDALLPGHGLFCLRHADLYLEHGIEILRQKWNGFLMGGPAFYPSWWLMNHREIVET